MAGGRILVDEHLRVTGVPRVFAMGDCAVDEAPPPPPAARGG